MSEVAPGSVVGGDFRILRPLQAGGMGAVYIAEQLSTGKQRALKLMHARLVDDPVQRQRFVREARVAAKVDSEHVVEILAAGVTDEGAIPWLAMELLRGCDLSRLIRESGPLPLEHALPIMEQLCHGLGAAHDAGVIHRDLKPQNIFLSRLRSSTRPWTVKVLDFGIAKVVADRNNTTAALGSPAWMAPEQTDTSSDMAPAADVWALGLVLFWMLTGRFYWKAMSEGSGGVEAVLREMLFEPLEAPSGRARWLDDTGEGSFPPRLDDWFLRCLERDPKNRFANAGHAWEALRELRGDDAPPSHFLPPEVAELAARAAADQLTPAHDDSVPPTAPTRDVGDATDATRPAQLPPGAEPPGAPLASPAGSSRGDEAAGALPPTRRDGTPTSEDALSPSSEVRTPSAAPTPGPRDDKEQGPTLQSHELALAREEAAGSRPWLKVVMAAAFVVGAAGAYMAMGTREGADVARETSAAGAQPSSMPTGSAPTHAPSGARPPERPAEAGDPTDPIDALLFKAETALRDMRIDAAEKLAAEALTRLGGVNGRRPASAPAQPQGERAQTIIARVALARARLKAPLSPGAKAPDVEAAARDRRPFFDEASAACTKAGTWVDEGGGRCCQGHLAQALAELSSAGEARNARGWKTWASQATGALDKAQPAPNRCREMVAAVQRQLRPEAPSPAPAGAPAPRLQAFNAAAANAAVARAVATARSQCKNRIGARSHTFTITFVPSGRVTVSGPQADPTSSCIYGYLSNANLPPFTDASTPPSRTVTVTLD